MSQANWSRRPPGSETTDRTVQSPLVVVPIGAFEQHGAHLPLDTDTVIATALVASATDALSPVTRRRIFVTPPVTISASDEHLGFPGTLSAGTEATAAMVAGIARSAATWACGTLFVNGHGGNSDALASARRALTHGHISHALWWPQLPDGARGDLHAGYVETSVMLHIDAGAVDLSSVAPGEVGDPGDLIERMRRGGVMAVSPNGVIGDPTGATAEFGAHVFALWVDDLVTTLESRLAAWSNATS